MLPLFIKGSVIAGFGRGSKQLGIPTGLLHVGIILTCKANLPVNDGVLDQVPTGIYYAFVSLSGKVYKAAMSIGYNPQFHNTKKTLVRETMSTSATDVSRKRIFCMSLTKTSMARNFELLSSVIYVLRSVSMVFVCCCRMEDNIMFYS